ncbi:hypothetical protein B0J14DRAFT_574134 [Halenospora varia]|nr:hypothetical protein B0J14DRAFT_574134 [Halenospora varia]
MQFTSIIAASILATLALASPAPAAEAVPAPDVEVEAIAGLVEMWVDVNFRGSKYTGSGNAGTCYNVPSGFNDRLSSGKSKSGYKCTVWNNAGCGGSKYEFHTSSSFPSFINDHASSWKCVRG